MNQTNIISKYFALKVDKIIPHKDLSIITSVNTYVYTTMLYTMVFGKTFNPSLI